MTYNEKKQFLENYGYSVRKIKRLLQEYEEWETIGTSITQKFSNTPVQVSGNRSRVESCALKLAELQQAILEEMEEAEFCRTEIESAIGGIKDTRRRELLEMRYIKGLSAHKIATKMGKLDKNIYKQLRNTINRLDM
jgi:DNA-directed RNA polymerase specialized sigma24 family protein